MLANLDRTYQMMDQYGIDAIIVSTPENLLYFADYAPWNVRTYRGNTPQKGIQAFAVIPGNKDIEPCIIPMGTNYTALVYPAQFPGWVNDFYPYAPDSAWPGEIPEVPSFSQLDVPREVLRLRELTLKFKPRAEKTAKAALIKALSEKGLAKATIAFESMGASPAVIEGLKSELPGLVMKEAAEFLRLVRAVKTPQEIYYLRRAGEINEQAFSHIRNLMYPGITTEDLAHEHHKMVVSERGLPAFLNIAAIAHSATMWEPSDYILRKGDVIWMDGGCSYHHYHSDTGMSCVIGEPSTRVKKNWIAVETAMNAAKDACRPGARCSEVQKALYDSLVASGVKTPFCMGHGIGLEEREYPLALGAFGGLGASVADHFSDEILSGSSDLLLEPNMVMCIEVNIFEWGSGGVKAEQTMLVNPNGCEMLFPHDRVLSINRETISREA